MRIMISWPQFSHHQRSLYVHRPGGFRRLFRIIKGRCLRGQDLFRCILIYTGQVVNSDQAGQGDIVHRLNGALTIRQSCPLGSNTRRLLIDLHAGSPFLAQLQTTQTGRGASAKLS